jgi:diguanylate cyclase (GGDEF)-like protein
MQKSSTFFPKVGEIAHKGIVQISGSALIEEAIVLMEANNLSDVVYQLEQGHGIFTVEDLIRHRRLGRSLTMRLMDLETHLLDYVNEDENVLHLLALFVDKKSRYLGVKNQDGLLDGIVSYTDVLASVDPIVMMEHKTLAEILKNGRVEMIAESTATELVLDQLIYAEDAMLIESGGKLAGIVTTRDIVRMIRDGIDLTLPIRCHMTTPVYTINHRETIKSAIDYLKERKFKRAIVVDDEGNLNGVVSQLELISITYGRWAELMKLHAHELGELVQVLESKNIKLQHESLTDALTGTGNRRMINQAIEAEIGRYYRHERQAFSILLLDIDFFKRINDNFGHPVGDEVLQLLCLKLKALLRVSDTLARWGGEEFVILLPTADIDSAAILAERMRAEVEKTSFNNKVVTISISAAEYQRGESQEMLLKRLDLALYEAKNTGRNKVIVAQ